jgi:hypothetical protein
VKYEQRRANEKKATGQRKGGKCCGKKDATQTTSGAKDERKQKIRDAEERVECGLSRFESVRGTAATGSCSDLHTTLGGKVNPVQVDHIRLI